MKHIESIQPEYAAGDLSRLLVSEPDATASAALTALLHNVTGCAIPPLATTPQSDVDELVPLAVSILRRHWQTPLTALGDGTTPMSLADLMRRLIGDRVQGNEALGILPANDNIPHAVAALRERKISGVPELPDGVSFARLLCDSSIANTITELIDDNIGWVMTKALPWSTFPNVTKATLNMEKVFAFGAIPSNLHSFNMPQVKIWRVESLAYYKNDNITDIVVPELEQMDNGFTYDNPDSGCFISTCANLKKVTIPKLGLYGKVDGYEAISNNGLYCCLIHSCPNLKEVYLPSYQGWNWRIVRNVPNLKKLVLGNITSGVPALYSSYAYPFYGCVNLIHLEFAGVQVSLNLSSYNPTSVLSDSSRLPEFLSNFRLYIADRLSDNGSGKTLTLSQAVRDAIQQDPEIVSIITSKGWTISPAPSV